MNPPQYENDMNFDNYTTNLKPIAIYYPQILDINESDSYKFINKTFLFKNINNSVALAKKHGIYGFAIYYNYNKRFAYILNEEIDIFLSNKYINFPFFLIWKNKNFFDLINQFRNKVVSYTQLLEVRLDKFVKNIKRYLKYELYIKIKSKPILSIEQPFNIKHLKRVILILRKKMIENNIGKIFILYPIIKEYNISKKQYLFDGVYDQSPIDWLRNDSKKRNIHYFSGIVYKNIFMNDLKFKPTFFFCSMLDIENEFLKSYTPEKYYLLNKIIIHWTERNYKKNKGIFLIYSWNNYQNENYLEPNKKYGYASLNSFSRALFNLPNNQNFYNFVYLKGKKIISVQAHLFYIDLLPEIINKTNNIPLLFDLFITIILPFSKDYVEENLKKYSKSDKYEIQIVVNKGRDVLPFLTQMKGKIKEYKYICHIHTKKSQHNPLLGSAWRNYLFDNLLGDKHTILEIIYDFEINDKLGFIFPDTYYNNINGVDNYESSTFRYHQPNIKYMNFILKHLFKKNTLEVGKQLIFPSGNMFWARFNAIYQIFNINFKNIIPKEKNQINGTFMHAIERIWLYLVKLNGYYYKIIFKRY